MNTSKSNTDTCKKVLSVITAHTLSELVSKVNIYNQQDNVSSITNEDILTLYEEDHTFFLLFFTA